MKKDRGGRRVRRNVLEYLEEAAEAVSDQIVFGDEKRTVTYGEFLARAKRIGSGLAKLLEGRAGRPVAVLADRSIQPLEGFFGTVFSGNFYVPVDRRMPAERIRLLLETLRPEALLTGEGEGRLLANVFGSEAAAADSPQSAVFPYLADESGVKEAIQDRKTGSLVYGKDGTYSLPVRTLDELAETEADEVVLTRIRRAQLDTDPLYAIFTSGSTGVPKGVLVSHRSVLDLADQFREEFGFGPDRVFGNQAPFDFDVSVKDIYSTLCCRGTMYVVPQMLFSFPVRLVQYLNEKRINTIIWAVSALRILENLNGFSAGVPQYLRQIMFSGEAMTVKVLNYWREYLPEAEYINLYGPTEITCNCTFYRVDREFAPGELLPIGIPFKNSGVFLLDGEEQVRAAEEPGEICVRGTCLALGYYRNPERTAEAFCQNPLNRSYPERIYRTGDIGKYDKDGNLVFLGRKDTQIKHMGHRIELGEVEAAVNGIPWVSAGVCLYVEGQIILCYEAETPGEREILRAMGKKLPKYMLPTKLCWYPELPLNKNGKIDRAALNREFQKIPEGQ